MNKSLIGNELGKSLTQFIPVNKKLDCTNSESILNTVTSGFGWENTLIKDNKTNEYKTHLCKEYYLGEFKEESEKKLVRNNLDVYSKEEIRKIISGTDSSFLTKEDLENAVKELDYVTSILNKSVNYEIPNDLFEK